MGFWERHRSVTPSIRTLALVALAACGDDAGNTPDAACVPEDDGIECTDEVCVGGAVTHTPRTGQPCATGMCSAQGMCLAPSCTDGVKNGTETGLDCGGSCAPALKCAAGGGCAS